MGRGHLVGCRIVLREYTEEIITVDDGLGYIGVHHATENETLAAEKDRMSCGEECFYRRFRKGGLATCSHDIYRQLCSRDFGLQTAVPSTIPD